MKNDLDRISKVYQPRADQANSMAETAQLIQSITGPLSSTTSPVAMGRWATEKQDLGRILIGLGISPDTVAQKITNVASGDVIQKNFLIQSASAVRQLGAREPGSVIALFSKAYPNLETQPQAVRLMENVFLMNAQRDKDALALANGFYAQNQAGLAGGKPYQPLSRFEADFNSGAHSAGNYLRAAQIMSGDRSGWSSLKTQAAQDAIWALIPPGEQFLGPDGKIRVKQ